VRRKQTSSEAFGDYIIMYMYSCGRTNITLYSAKAIIVPHYELGTLAVDGWTVTFGTARKGLGGAAASPGPFSLYQM